MYIGYGDNMELYCTKLNASMSDYMGLHTCMCILSLVLSFFFLQHFIFVISAALAWLIPDVPQSVKNEIQKEKLLAFEAVHARQQAGKELGVKAEAASPSPPLGGEGTEF